MDIGIRFKQLSENVKNLTIEVKKLKQEFSASDLWDNSDMIRNWKVSKRTLAQWRAEGLIGYVQVGNKIWYPREERDLFLSRNLKNEDI